MDPLTHGLVGAMASQSVSDKKTMRPAAVTGFLSAMLADVDTFIYSASDPLLNVEVHRQFTHALIFIPAGATVATLLLWLVMKRYLTLGQVFLFSLAGYATSGLLDAFTSYGTELLWPFLDTRYAWNLLSIIDPVLTAGLLTLVVMAILKTTKRPVWLAWGWFFMILSIGWIQQNRAEHAMQELASQRGHELQEYVVKPTIGNRILWRATYIHNGQVQTDAVRAGFFSSPVIYEGESAPLIIPDETFSKYKGTTMYADLQRFSRLSNHFLIRHPEEPMVIGDARHSMLPTSLVPLWGVKADTAHPDDHLLFLYFRDASEEIRKPFLEMLLGRKR